MASHSLFPRPSVPKLAMPNPHARKPSLGKNAPSMMNKDSKKDASFPVPTIPSQHLPPPPPPLESPSLGVEAVVESSAITGTTPTHAAYPPPPPPRRDQHTYSATDNEKSKEALRDTSNDSGYRSSSPNNPKSPVVPIRSMFPTYDPSVPLGQQSYYPQRPVPAHVSGIWTNRLTRPEYGSGVTAMNTAPPSVVDFDGEPTKPHASSRKDLELLWEASHGMEPSLKVKPYYLELARTEEAKFTLGPDSCEPFYSLVTYDTNELAVTKTHPMKPTVSCDVAINSIEPGSRRYPPQDGLVTFIFPKTAAMLAINQSTQLAKDHELAPTHRDEIQQVAVRRAADQEASKLRWNDVARRYELEHPAIGRKSRGPNFVMSPNSPAMNNLEPSRPPVLHITISSHAIGTAVEQSSHPIITVTNPDRNLRDDESTFSGPPQAGIRLSTIPVPDSDTPLASLDFNTMMVSIDTNQILDLMPSLFAIDSIVCAILATAVADESTNPVMAGMEISIPKPIIASRRAIGSSPHVGYAASDAGATSVGGRSTFYATVAEREEAEAEAKAMREMHDRDVRGKKTKRQRKWFGARSKDENEDEEAQETRKERRARKKSEKKRKQVNLHEFDLEKLGHYQAGDRKGQELPAVTRGLLSVLVGTLRIFVFIITSIVRFLVWLLVSVTRGVTSEKF